MVRHQTSMFKDCSYVFSVFFKFSTPSRFFLPPIHALSHCVALCFNFYKLLLSILEMSGASYVCTVCSQQFTRKYSGQRHNFNIHSGGSEIMPYIEYMAGRNSGRYLASHPSWFRKQRGFQSDRSYPSENRVIADTTSSFRPETCLLTLQVRTVGNGKFLRSSTVVNRKIYL
jgi:hypothetical protein